MPQRPLPQFEFWKNPYHLFVKALRACGYPNQKDIAEALQKTVAAARSGRSPHMDRTELSNLVRLNDYLDFANTSWRETHEPHFQAMNDMLRRDLNEKNLPGIDGAFDVASLDIFDLDQRAKLERLLNYKYPANDEKLSNVPTSEQKAVRGIWQLFHPSALEEHTASPANAKIRSVALVIFGFLPSPSVFNAKPWVKALLVGRSGVWRAKVWNKGRRLLVSAEALVTREDQFFVFDIPNFEENPYGEDQVTVMRGIVSGSVFDERYRDRADVGRRYPIMAAPCIARKLVFKTEWFEANDTLIDNDFTHQLKADMPCDYFEVEELMKLDRGPRNKFKTEYFANLRELLQDIEAGKASPLTMPYLR